MKNTNVAKNPGKATLRTMKNNNNSVAVNNFVTVIIKKYNKRRERSLADIENFYEAGINVPLINV